MFRDLESAGLQMLPIQRGPEAGENAGCKRFPRHIRQAGFGFLLLSTVASAPSSRQGVAVILECQQGLE
jgi:hypothetical protein